MQIPDRPVATNNTSPNLGPSKEMPKSVKETPQVTIVESVEEVPQVTIEESVKETPLKKSKARLRKNKKLKKLASEAKVNSSDIHPDPIYNNPYVRYDGPSVSTAKEERAYHHAKRLKDTNYFYPTYVYVIGLEVALTPDGSEPSTPKPRTHSPRQPLPPTPRMSRLEIEAAKNARTTPKTVSISPTPLPQAVKAESATPTGIPPVSTPLDPAPLPQVVEAEQAPTTGIPPVPVPLEPTILPQTVEAEQAPTAGIPPAPVPLDPTISPQDIETAGFTTAEPTISPLEAAQVPLTGAQTTVANTARSRMLNDARLLGHRQRSSRVNTDLLISEALNSAARTSILTKTTLSQHVRLQKRNLTVLSVTTRELSTFKATTLKDARTLAIHASVLRRISQTAPSVSRASVVQELDAHLLCITEARLAPFSLRKLFHRLSQMVPSPHNLDPPGLNAKKPTRKRKPATDPLHLYRAATRHVKASTLNISHLLETQKRLTATKDGPFLDPGSPPTVLALPFIPPSWAAVMTGGYRHHRIRRHLHVNHKPHHRPSRKETGKERRANRRKTTRSCAGPDPGPGRRPHSGPPQATPSRSSYTPARPYRHNDGYYRHGERDDDDRGRPLPPPPPNPPRGDLPHLQIRCHYSDHIGQCERICTPTNRGQFRFRLVRKHTTLTVCSRKCMESFIGDERDTLISQPFPPHVRAAADAFLNKCILELNRGKCPDNPRSGYAWPLRSILNRTVRVTGGVNLQERNTCAVLSRFLYDITINAVNYRVEEDVV